MRTLLYNLTVLCCLFATSSYAENYCFASKCYDYEVAENIPVGGMNLPDGKYRFSEFTSRYVDEKLRTTILESLMWVQGNNIRVERKTGLGEEFVFLFDRNKNIVKIENIVGISELLKPLLTKIAEESAADLLKNHGYFSSGETKEVKGSVDIFLKPKIHLTNSYSVLGITKINDSNKAIIEFQEIITAGSDIEKSSGYILSDPDTGVRHYYEKVGTKISNAKEKKIRVVVEYDLVKLE